MNNIRYAVIAAAIFSSGVFFGATGFDDAVAANKKTYKVLIAKKSAEVEPALNEMTAQGWTFEQITAAGMIVFSK